MKKAMRWALVICCFSFFGFIFGCSGGSGDGGGEGAPPSASPAVCGDGAVSAEAGEECDDGNTVSGDGCSDKCLFEVRTGSPRVVDEGGHCDARALCKEGLRCEAERCYFIDVAKDNPCSETRRCASGLSCRDGFCREGVTVVATPPRVSSVVPGPGTVDAPLAGFITVEFDRDMQSAPILDGRVFQLKAGETVLPGTIAMDGLRKLTFMPISALAPSTTYAGVVTREAVDTTGNALEAEYSWTFTTAAVPDTVKPVLISVSPSDTPGERASIRQDIVLVFNEPMKEEPFTRSGTSAALQLKYSGTRIDGSVRMEDGNRHVIFSHPDLRYDSDYQVELTTEAVDMAGNALERGRVWLFHTEIEPVVPRVINMLPLSGAVGVSAIGCVEAVFNVPMQRSSITGSSFYLKKLVEGVPVEPPVAMAEPDLSEDGLTARLCTREGSPLEYNTKYWVEVTGLAVSLAGLAVEPAGWGFQTNNAPDTTAPTIIEKSPVGDVVLRESDIRIVFNEIMQDQVCTEAVGVRVTRRDALTGEMVPVTLESACTDPATEGNKAQVRISGGLIYGAQYTVTVTSDAKDLAGNSLAEYSWTFTVEREPDRTPPSVVEAESYPAVRATNVPVDKCVTVAFSEDVRTGDFDTYRFFELSPAIAVEKTWDGASRVTFCPTGGSLLAYGTTYRVLLDADIKDLGGNSLGTPPDWTFTTIAEPDRTPPRVTAVTPSASGILNPSAMFSVRLDFDEKLDCRSVTASNLTLTPGGFPAQTFVNCTMDDTNHYVTIYLASLGLAANYELVLKNGEEAFRDLAGNKLADDRVISFTTRSGAWSSSPESFFSLSPGQTVDSFTSVITDGGMATVVWRENNSDSVSIHTHTGLVTEPPRERVHLDVGLSGSASPSVGIDAWGNLMSLFENGGGIYATKSLALDTWPASTIFVQPSLHASFPVIAGSGAGGFFTVWVQNQNSVRARLCLALTDGGVDSCFSPASSSVSLLSLLSATGKVLEAPIVKANDIGDAVVAWRQAMPDGTRKIFLNRFSPGRTVSDSTWLVASPLEVTAAGAVEVSRPSLTISANGDAMAVWSERGSDGRQKVFARRYSKKTGPDAAVLLDGDLEYDATMPVVAADGGGNFVTAWVRSAAGTQQIYSKRYRNGAETPWATEPSLTVSSVTVSPAILEPASDLSILVDLVGNATIIVKMSGRLWVIQDISSDSSGWLASSSIDGGSSRIKNITTSISPQGRIVVFWDEGERMFSKYFR